MDLSTHLTLAAKLLDACGLSRRAAIYALLPEIDLKPAHFHRMFGNVLMHQTTILDAAIEIFQHPAVRERDFIALRDELAPAIAELKHAHQSIAEHQGADRSELQAAYNRYYCYLRIAESLPDFFKELDEVSPLLGEEILQPSTDRAEGAVALVSHTYFVTYTYPPMPFIPFSPMASQRIKFADRIDYFDFKGFFVESKGVAELRQQIHDHEEMWTRSLSFAQEPDPVIRGRCEADNGKPYQPFAMVKAMIERLGELAPGIEYDAVQKGIRWYLGYLGCVRIVHCDRERYFVEHLDQHLEQTLLDLMP